MDEFVANRESVAFLKRASGKSGVHLEDKYADLLVADPICTIVCASNLWKLVTTKGFTIAGAGCRRSSLFPAVTRFFFF